MGWFDAVLLGIVQGLTEFLPISSSAHLRIVGGLTGSGDPGAAFTAVTQLGTETAVVIYFRKDIARILTAWFKAVSGRGPRDDPDARMGWLVIIGTLPIVALGLAFQDAIEGTFRHLGLVATMLVVFGLLLGYADRRGRKTRTLDTLTWKHGVAFGFAQALALVPGVSRSGGTITAGLLLGYTREASARYAFLLAIPAVFGSGLYTMTDIGEGNSPAWGPTIAATAVAFAVGYVVIVQFMKFISHRSYAPFVIYRLALAAVVVVLLATGVLTPDAGA